MPEGDTVVQDTPEFKEALEAAVKAKLDEETEGLRTNRDAILKEKRELAKKLDGYSGLDPEEYATLKAADEKRQREDAEAAGEFGKLEAQLKDQHSKELEKHQGRIGTLQGALENELVQRSALEELAKHSDTPGLLLPHVLKHVKMVEDNGKFGVLVIDDEGNPRIAPDAKGTGDLMTITQLVGSMKEQDEFKPGFRGSGGAGSSASGSGNGGSGGPAVLDPGDRTGVMANLEGILAGTTRIQL